MFGGAIIGEEGAKRDKYYSGVGGNSAVSERILSVTNTRISSTLAKTVFLAYGPYHPTGCASWTTVMFKPWLLSVNRRHYRPLINTRSSSNVAGRVTRLQAGHPSNSISIPGRGKKLYSKSFIPAVVPTKTCIKWVADEFYLMQRGRGGKRTTSLHLMPRLRMSGAVPPNAKEK